ncbi:MAG: 23S rRNA pseudouridine(2605) synthase RluB [Endozoicomonas sp. (ex Botrylloides leachii)]|nr:23S rRNA pseudouridine(2605) synthase RluB [Endozoicomonas sp. (ex Botrylloides leachii)]
MSNINTTASVEPLKSHPVLGEKLQKILAGAGLGSRRKMEQWIKNGRIMLNGKQATLGDRALPQDTVTVDNKTLKLDAYRSGIRRVIAYNKPEGEICTRSDPKGRPSVFDQLPRLKGERWIAIGRLDINTSGLLLFTTDGELANRLMHPSNTIEREYAVRVMGRATPDKIKRLVEGVELDDGPAHFTDIVSAGGSGINQWFHVCLLEGRNREVRRLWASQDLTVNRLKRVRFGNTFMPEGLRAGHWQELGKADIDGLSALVDLPPAKTYIKTPSERMAKQPKRSRVVTNKKSPSKAAKNNWQKKTSPSTHGAHAKKPATKPYKAKKANKHRG